MYSLGIDTSCYTTSVALVKDRDQLELDLRCLLQVQIGKRGLRQSDALFMHLQNLPLLLAQVFDYGYPIGSVAVTDRPRSLQDSYLPVFVAGRTVAHCISASLGVPLFTCSHQANHLMAGRWSAQGPMDNQFLALHLSGGTTDLLFVQKADEGLFEIISLGGGADLHVGQFVDRVGVAMGLPFPAGNRLEKLAASGDADGLVLPVSVKDLAVSFSGPEAAAMRYLEQGVVSRADLALAVQKCIAQTLQRLLRNAAKHQYPKRVLFVGGVSANQYIRNWLSEHLTDWDLYFADPKYSTDNAVGTALWGLRG
ncbi:MAG: O-sialoglycoprotein endopeptidase [Limnochordia bacterium]|nr:O-sialoglycoprotein endopeptidase [Limnochordia bacterium]MDD4518439.1 O-sialoglycoprotein endopeptidase [Limnochordia bacterium]